MTNEEAIEMLKDVTIYHRGQATREALDRATTALEKQIPKKPLNVKELIIDCNLGECPRCRGGVNETMLYCSDCGQRLEWKR